MRRPHLKVTEVCIECGSEFQRRPIRLKPGGNRCVPCALADEKRRRVYEIKGNKVEYREDYAVLVTSKGEEILCDNADVPFLSGYTWHVDHSSGKAYARAMTRTDGIQSHVKMHRLLLSAPEGVLVDHWNGNGLDNRRENLRLATHAQNICNSKRYSHNKSGYKGVYAEPKRGRWSAQIRVDKKLIYLGSFENVLDAARAYNEAALLHFGEFARINDLDG